MATAIAEGYGRKTTADYIRMLYVSYGSICELETQILLAGDLEFIESGYLGAAKRDIEEIERMLMALIKSLENKHLPPWILESSSATEGRADPLRFTQNHRVTQDIFIFSF